MANRFYINPPNPLEALMTGVQGYEGAQKRAKQNELDAAYKDVGQQISTGGGLNNSALGRLIGLGPQGAPLLTAAAALGKGNSTDDIREYEYDVKNGGFKGTLAQWMQNKRPQTTVNVDNKGESSFETEFGKKQADRWNKYIEGGQTAEKKLVDIANLREIGRRVGSQGMTAEVKAALGPYAEAVGINIADLSDIQAYNSIIERLTPQQRVEGSGSTSDVEFKGMRRAMPTLLQNPEAREITLNTMEAIERHDMERASIASRLATKEITRAQAEKELRALPDPMKGFAEWRKKNPELYGSALKGTASPPPAAGAPSFSPPRDWSYSPSRKQFRDPAGKLYDQNGRPL